MHVVSAGCSKNIISMTQLMSEGWIITSRNSTEMTMSYKKKHIVFKTLEKNLYYLEGKPGGNGTEVNVTVWEELTDNKMPDLFNRTYESSSSEDDSSDDDGMPILVDRDCESSESSDGDSEFSASDLHTLFGGNVYTSVFMD